MSMVLATLEAHSGCDHWHCEGNGQAESGRSSYLATEQLNNTHKAPLKMYDDELIITSPPQILTNMPG